MKKDVRVMWGLIFSSLLSGCVYNISLFQKAQPFEEQVVEGSGNDKIALIDISGVISEERPDGLIEAPDLVARVKEELSRAAADPAVKGIVLRVNSPGGTVTASDIIYHEIQRFKQGSGKKVIASIVDVGASGAYYLSMAADKIMAHPTAITGSIGVIVLHVNLQGLLEKIGVGAESIKSGPLKDLGSPIKPLSTEERDILQGIINHLYGRFLEVIVEGRRNLTPERIKALADGRVYTAMEAKAFGLIDQIGYLDQAIDLAKSEAGIKEAKVILYRRPHEYKNNIYSQMVLKNDAPLSAIISDWGADPGRLLQGGSAKFFYLWAP